MTEIGTKPDQVGKTWAEEGPDEYPSPFPPDAKADVGWQPEGLPLPEDPGEIIPADWWNGIVQYIFRAINWIAAGHIRVFETLAGGIAATAPPDVFIVRSPASGLRAMGEVAFSAYGGAGPSTGANNYIFLPCTDGERIYYHEGEILANKIYAADPLDGSTIWGPKTVGTSANGLCCDGHRIYYTDIDDVLAVYSLNPSDGSAIGSSEAAGLGITKLRSNGLFLIGMDPTNERVHVHSDISETAGSITYNGYVQSPVGSGSSLGAIGIDHVNGYFGGNRGLAGTYDVHQFDIASRVIGWQITLPTTSRHTIKGIVSDGITVYVSADVQTLTAGGTASVYALNALNGNILWSTDTIYNSHVDAIAIDDYWLYVGNENQNNTFVLDKRSGVIVTIIANHVAYGADGVSTIGQGGSLSPNGDKLTRNWRGGPSREFQRVTGDDENRHPFYTGAVPMHERP